MLAELLPAELFPFFLVFIRLGAAMMMMPAIGENGVSTRARLLLSIALTAVVTPLIADTLPGLPAGPFDLGLLIIGEAVIGLFFGATTRMVMAALHVAGMIFAFAQYRRGRLGDAILAHAVANLLIGGYTLGWEQWSLWV